MIASHHIAFNLVVDIMHIVIVSYKRISTLNFHIVHIVQYTAFALKGNGINSVIASGDRNYFRVASRSERIPSSAGRFPHKAPIKQNSDDLFDALPKKMWNK